MGSVWDQCGISVGSVWDRRVIAVGLIAVGSQWNRSGRQGESADGCFGRAGGGRLDERVGELADA